MEKFFTVSRTAKLTGLTAEALRHYDRINLVKPSKRDEWTGYRYYSADELVRLNTVKALLCMDLTLAEIKEILDNADLEKTVELLRRAEDKADGKIAELEFAKNKISRARAFYESKQKGETHTDGFCVEAFPERVILLSDTMDKPTLDNLWDYHRRFYDQIDQSVRADFTFEDLAGIYESGGKSRLFAVCSRYKAVNGLKILPEGDYLCADCTEENRGRVLKALLKTAESRYGAVPEFTVYIIVLSGILNWNYRIQVKIN